MLLYHRTSAAAAILCDVVEDGKRFREFLIPAAVVSRFLGSAQLQPDDVNSSLVTERACE